MFEHAFRRRFRWWCIAIGVVAVGVAVAFRGSNGTLVVAGTAAFIAFGMAVYDKIDEWVEEWDLRSRGRRASERLERERQARQRR